MSTEHIEEATHGGGERKVRARVDTAALLGPEGALIGRRLGGYVVDRKLGEGGMGSVFLLRHAVLPHTRVVLKVLTEATLDLKARFAQEALVAAAVGSHRVAKPWDVGE